MEFIQENLINWLLLTVIYILCLLWNVLYFIFKESKLKKEHEDQLVKERIEWEDEREKFKEQIDVCIRNNTYWSDEYEKEKKSNSANKGWNIKYRKTIEELNWLLDYWIENKKDIKWLIRDHKNLEEKNQELKNLNETQKVQFKKAVDSWKEQNQDQADTIKRLINKKWQ